MFFFVFVFLGGGLLTLAPEGTQFWFLQNEGVEGGPFSVQTVLSLKLSLHTLDKIYNIWSIDKWKAIDNINK